MSGYFLLILSDDILPILNDNNSICLGKIFFQYSVIFFFYTNTVCLAVLVTLAAFLTLLDLKTCDKHCLIFFSKFSRNLLDNFQNCFYVIMIFFRTWTGNACDDVMFHRAELLRGKLCAIFYKKKKESLLHILSTLFPIIDDQMWAKSWHRDKF